MSVPQVVHAAFIIIPFYPGCCRYVIDAAAVNVAKAAGMAKFMHDGDGHGDSLGAWGYCVVALSFVESGGLSDDHGVVAAGVVEVICPTTGVCDNEVTEDAFSFVREV